MFASNLHYRENFSQIIKLADLHGRFEFSSMYFITEILKRVIIFEKLI